MSTVETIVNPFLEMEKYTCKMLLAMNKQQLIDVQRSILFPHEQELFDKNEPIVLKSGDDREKFLDYTDRLITSFEMLD